MMSIAKPQGPKRLRTTDIPVGKGASTHGSKKSKLKRTSKNEWGSLLLPEPEDQAPRVHTESLP